MAFEGSRDMKVWLPLEMVLAEIGVLQCHLRLPACGNIPQTNNQCYDVDMSNLPLQPQLGNLNPKNIKKGNLKSKSGIWHHQFHLKSDNESTIGSNWWMALHNFPSEYRNLDSFHGREVRMDFIFGKVKNDTGYSNEGREKNWECDICRHRATGIRVFRFWYVSTFITPPFELLSSSEWSQIHSITPFELALGSGPYLNDGVVHRSQFFSNWGSKFDPKLS